jgi:hypothetical protein
MVQRHGAVAKFVVATWFGARPLARAFRGTYGGVGRRWRTERVSVLALATLIVSSFRCLPDPAGPKVLNMVFESCLNRIWLTARPNNLPDR